MFCEHCGADNQADAVACFACQHPLSVADQAGASTPATSSAATSSINTLAANVLIKGRYRIIECVGQGGFGSVYKARDELSNDTVIAVKEIDMELLKPQQVIEATDAFNREVKALLELKHVNLPRLYDHFTDTEHWYMVMDFIEGETLEHYIDQAANGSILRHGLPLLDVIEICIQLCDVLGYMHGHNPPVIFRDLKPANVMLAPGNTTTAKHVFLIDFGIARQFKPGQARDTMAFGSPGYAAPEQYGKAQTTPRSDIYSLGAILHQMLTGKDPSESPFRFAPIRTYDSALPSELEWLIAQMLDLDPDRRPAQTSQIRDELQLIADRYRKSGGHLTSTSIYQGLQAQGGHPATSTPSVQQPPVYGNGKQAQVMYVPSSQQQQMAASAQSSAAAATPAKKISRRGIVAVLVSLGIGSWLGSQIAGHKSSTMQDVEATSVARGGIVATEEVGSAGATATAEVNSAEATVTAEVNQGSGVSLGNPIEYQGHTAAVNAVAWDLLMTMLISGSDDMTVRAWSMDGSNKLVCKGHTQAVTTVAYTNTFTPVIVSGSLDKTVRFWDINTGEAQQSFTCSSAINTLACAYDNTLIAVGGVDGKVYMYAAGTWQVMNIYKGHKKSIRAIAWSSDSLLVASASEDNTVQVWERDGTPVFTYRGHSNVVNALAWSADGNRLASASSDGTVQVWDATSGKHVVKYTGHLTNDQPLNKTSQTPPTIVTSVTWGAGTWDWSKKQFIPEAYIASATNRGAIHLWNATTGQFLCEQTSPGSTAIRMLAWSNHNSAREFIAAGGDAKVVEQYGVTV